MIQCVIHNIEELKIFLDRIPGSATFDIGNINSSSYTDKMIATYIPENNCVYFE